GPNAHCIRPESYTAIDNFYTSTVYEKGAEVIRMLQTLLGHDGFRRGMALYFERHDGSAVTCEDFLQAMEQANDVAFPQFRRWYSQAGTPEIEATGEYDPETRVYTLRVAQSCAPTPDGSPKEPFLIPMTLGLLGQDGQELPTTLRPGCVESRVVDGELVCMLAEAEHELIFEEVSEWPVPSLLRSFSAPVKMRFDYSDSDLRLLMSQDSDSFNRYDAAQRLLTTALGGMIETLRDDEAPSVSDDLLEAFGTLLDDAAGDCAFRACTLVLPTVAELNQERNECDFANADIARRLLLQAFADRAASQLLDLYQRLRDAGHTMDQEAMGRRALRARCLHILSHREDGAECLAREQFGEAICMTETIAALEALCRNDTLGREWALTEFRDRWHSDFNVMNKWFALQAGAPLERAFTDVGQLVTDDLFDLANPNRVRSVHGAFARNLPSLHHVSGRGYTLITDLILHLDGMNAHMAAGLAKCFKDYARLDDVRKALLAVQLERIAEQTGLSAGTREIIDNIRSHAFSTTSCNRG
ncbi:MAG: DUF3458 domain-containing protein, partial [Lentisphaeria bacterium]|nr:DUF3458 domain-containing protein [Lentisphaeria bacterium]